MAKDDNTLLPHFGQMWIADISFFPGNFTSRYVIRIEQVLADKILFTPFTSEPSGMYASDKMNLFQLVRKIDMGGGL